MTEKPLPPDISSGIQSHKGLALQTKFLLWVAFALIVLCLTGAYFVYVHERRLLEEAAIEKSQLVMAAVESARSYVREELRPQMYDLLGQDAFVLQAMSTSYVGRAVMDRFKQTMPDYVWRRVATNARNPDYDPRPFEREMIEYFKENRDRESWQGIVETKGYASFFHVRPVSFGKSCLRCHGDPRAAPRALLEIYGSERGFGHQVGEISGVSAVSIPVEVALSKIRERAISVFGAGILAVTLLFVIISFLFNRVVIHSLRDLLEVFRQGLRSEKELELFQQAAAKDEIGELTSAAKVMSDHLGRARSQLEEYAGNLEEMVAVRTEALAASEENLKEKVAARNKELQTLITVAELITASDRLETVLPRILRQVLYLIPAQGAAIYLLKDNPDRLDLEWKQNADNLKEDIRLDPKRIEAAVGGRIDDLPTSLAAAAEGQMSFFPCKMNGPCLNVPLVCRSKVLGVMAFLGVNFAEITDEVRELLLSIGQQTGITIESLQNIGELVAGKELLQSVFNGITDMVVLLDESMRIQMVNQAHLRYFNVTEEEVLSGHCRKEKACRGCPFLQCNQDVIFETKKPFSEEIQSSKGEIFLVQYYPILDEKGDVSSVVRFAREVTADKEVERRIQQTEKLASLGQLSAGVAHEINNPLGVILCHTDLLKSQLAEYPQGLKDVFTVEKHALTCQRIVADLLNFARGQGTRRRLTHLNPALEEVIQMVRPQLKRKRCEIDLNLESNLPRLHLDEDKMKQVYLNLMMNALHAVDHKGIIKVSARKTDDGENVNIVFADNGPGIPPDLIPRIFDPFFSTKKTGEGTGLGLSVSYGIVQDHGGDISVESKPGEWTRFTITLPIKGEKVIHDI